MKGKKTTKKKALKKFEGTTPAALIQCAVAGGADLDKLERLLDLQLRWEANEAKKAYVIAMAAFQDNPPIIEKDKHVKFQTTKGTVEYNHATLANVTSKINKALSKHGLSAGWKTTQDDTGISVTCKITHNQGHSEETTLKSAPDLSGGKNAIQAIGSAVSYLERYTLLSLTGLATSDMDDDGKSTEKVDPKKPKDKTPETTPPNNKKKDTSPPVSIAQAMIIIQNIIGSHLTHNFEKWRYAKTLFDGLNLFTVNKASGIIEWWVGKKTTGGKVIKPSERIKRVEIEKQDDTGEALSNFLNDCYIKYTKKYPEDIKKYSHYCGLPKEKLSFDILDTKALLKKYMSFRLLLGLDDNDQEKNPGGNNATS